MSGRKIKLGEIGNGVSTLLIYCGAHFVPYGGCQHDGAMPLADAIARWGSDRRLDALPLVCSRCGSRAFDVRPAYNARPSEASESARLLDAWRKRPPGARQT